MPCFEGYSDVWITVKLKEHPTSQGLLKQ